MRLKSEIWVTAYLRRCQGEGVPVVIVQRGDNRRRQHSHWNSRLAQRLDGGQSTTRLGSFITCLSPDAIMRNRSHMSLVRLHKTVGVKVGGSRGVAHVICPLALGAAPVGAGWTCTTGGVPVLALEVGFAVGAAPCLSLHRNPIARTPIASATRM